MNYQDGFIKLEQINNLKESIKPGKIMLIPKTNIGIIEGDFYYVKKSGIKAYNELLSSEIAKQLGINSASYDLAYFNNSIYLISRLNNNKCYEVSKIMRDYYHTDKIFNYNNIDFINDAIVGLFNERDTSNIKNELINIFLFDVIITNPNRKLNDLKVVDDGYAIHFAPLYDNENMLLDEDTIFESNYTLGIKRGNVLINDLYSFLEKNSSLIDELSDKLEILNPNNIMEILINIENRTKGAIPNDLKKKYISGFSYNAGAIYNCILEIKKYKTFKKVI